MPIAFSIDNDRLVAAGQQQVTLDESPLLQTAVDANGTPTSDPDDDIAVEYNGTSLSGGLDAAFLTYLNALNFGSAAAKDAAFRYVAGVPGVPADVGVGAASSSANFIAVTTDANQAVNDLAFTINSALLNLDSSIVGLTTLANEKLFFHVDSGGNTATVTTALGAGGRIVAALYLDDPANAQGNHLTGQVQYVTFEALKHPVAGATPLVAHDDPVSFTDALQVTATGTTTFNFDNLESGSFLWAAFGTPNAAMMMTGEDLNVNDDQSKQGFGKPITGGGPNGDSSDTVNTSQAGPGATIGVNTQDIRPDGGTAVMTLVKGFTPLNGQADGTAFGDDVRQIGFTEYVNTKGASILLSQQTGNSSVGFTVTLWEAGGGNGTAAATDHAPADLHEEEGYGPPVSAAPGYIGNQDTDLELKNDWAVAVSEVKVTRGATTYVWNSGNSNTPQGGINVVINGNALTVTGLAGLDNVAFATADDPTNPTDGTFNRFKITGNTGNFDIGAVSISEGTGESVGIGSHLFVDDDGPTLSGLPVSKRVEEDELSTAGTPPPPLDGSDGITDGDASTDEVTYSNTELQAAVNAGSDKPAVFSLVTSVSGAVRDIDGNAMTSRGDAMTWSVSGGVVSAVAGGRTVLTITQTGGAGTATPTDDVFTVDLRDQLDHPNASGDTGIETLDITPAFAATDADGDTVDLNGAADDQETIQLVVENDVPAITAQIASVVVDGEVVLDSDGKSLNGAVGADDNSAANNTTRAGVKTYTFDSWTTPHNVWPNLVATPSADGATINYYEATGGDLVYSIVLNQTANSGAGQYTFTVHKPLPDQVLSFDFTDLPSGQNLFGTIAVDKADLSKGGLLVLPEQVMLDSAGLFVTSGQHDDKSGTVNTSKGGGPVTIGDRNQAFDDPGGREGAFFVYADNPVQAAVAGIGLDQNNADDADTIQFNGTIQGVTKASVEIVQASGSASKVNDGPGLEIKAYDINPGNIDTSAESRAFALNPLSGATQISISSIKIFDANHNLIEYRTNDGTAAGALQDSGDAGTNVTTADDSGVDITFVQNAGIWSVQATDLEANYTVEFETATAHDAALVDYLNGSYDIGGFNLLQGQDSPDQVFEFSVVVNDYDGDAFGGAPGVVFDDFKVGVDGTGAANDGAVTGVVV